MDALPKLPLPLADILARIAEYPVQGSTSCCHEIGAPPSGMLIEPSEPKMTHVRSSADA